ncbi:terminase [Desulfomarina profundi]|uniref:Terminase n=1 Tax=Desulfomarina profundi TaxID=2772557 RepID=A0A8D5FE73_9BACT|nr:terminase gpA endonuclease subunit [Desulfomarina profundi]BCL59952.1 terminase [Desulfomarina profundi]
MGRIAPVTDISRTKTVRLRTSPTWLPEKYRNRQGRVRISFKPTAGEKRFFRRRKHILPSVWAPKYRVVTYGPLEGSRWDNDFMPHMRGIMDASFFPSVRYIGNCKSPQGGSSAGAETILAYISDMQPGPAFVVYPDRDTGTKRFTDYLQPVFKKSPRLRRLLTGTSSDMASMRIKLLTMLIYLGWSGSVSSLGNISARYLIGDEVDKWVKYASKKEATTLKLFFERFRSYVYGGKCWLISTPSDPDGPIWHYMTKEAQVVFEYYIPCPGCGTIGQVEFKNIRFGDCRDPEEIEEKDLAKYVFPCCGLVGDDRVRIAALRKGLWYEKLSEEKIKEGTKPRELFACLRAEKPRKICFHSPGWISPLVTNSEIAAAFLRGLKNPEDMHYFDNQIAAKAHRPFRQARQTEAILALRDDRPEGLVPGGGQVAALVAGIDTQDNSFFFTVRAFGWGLAQESWLIRHGELDSFAALEEILFNSEYRDADGLYYPVHLAVIDSGGHRTSEVYDFTRMHPNRVLAYKGASGRKAKPYTKSVIDTYPGTNTKIPGGVELYICDTHHYKDRMAAKLRIKPDTPGAYHLHADTTEEFAAHYCAEYVDDRRLWQCPKNKANHYFDCGVMEMVASDILGIKFLNREGE